MVQNSAKDLKYRQKGENFSKSLDQKFFFGLILAPNFFFLGLSQIASIKKCHFKQLNQREKVFMNDNPE